MLERRRHELLQDVHARIRDARNDSALDRDVVDQGEVSESDIQDELQFALIQLKTDTLKKVDAALQRLEAGTYGDCFECGREIARPRLQALPFAVRCKDCEDVRERADRRERLLHGRHAPLFFDSSL